MEVLMSPIGASRLFWVRLAVNLWAWRENSYLRAGTFCSEAG
ncbi:hypothetical protein ALO59_101218 [Pseudomonas amygdali pv. mellea]|uniref:Uncharacterized protein n=2 Tax=Pseudomonas amygdali pv. lachrymans TaxID=53707 RepID=A0AB37QZN9_PSEAV|nr:hypothetical protein ALO51_101180 [Pseudomonas amygdali]KPX80288.1 hypothetical protein ALO59_101218 [Pseudomonas amygdali pv. mellea]KPY57125.1 hypothetical protein ALO93_101231 [Pseudomonas amygdali pv. sesami]RMM43707.1 hypothetical protein ALQ79_101151 [Pseudomonas amygdali pv. lachrymans]RMP37980.1 hypothetical protein ALQ26_101344 [Pseudomonas amygdali pv. lachrymans]